MVYNTRWLNFLYLVTLDPTLFLFCESSFLDPYKDVGPFVSPHPTKQLSLRILHVKVQSKLPNTHLLEV